MNILGITGGMSLINEVAFHENIHDYHDSAAVIVQNGKVTVAIEEERLNRIKHTNKAPLNAITYCLEKAGIIINDIYRFAFTFEEKTLNNCLKEVALENSNYCGPTNFRDLFKNIIKETFNYELPKEKIEFIPHHQAHAASTYFASGVSDALILVIDAGGDNYSGLIQSRCGNNIETLARYKLQNSLGQFYLRVIRHLGYHMFDEYKVMGLAPYGNPKTYRNLMNKLYNLEDKGGFCIFLERIDALLNDEIILRAKNAPFTKQHMDLAAALQEAIEKIVLHILEYYRKQTGHVYLCLAGGVAQNCSLNGRILREAGFKDVFVQPLSYDAGCAYGSALTIAQREGYKHFNEIKSVLWGKHIGSDNDIEKELNNWNDIITFEKYEQIEEKAADLIVNGKIIAWVQGRSEFGPRALGNRSILADPRKAEMKNAVNKRIKGREGYRPFAPSVLEEEAERFFYTNGKTYPFMNFVHYVKEEYRDKLGAITHIDGTARVHTVSKNENPMYWQLINSFYKITGVPVILNTSYNNNHEPIVENIFDALTTFLTTELDFLIIGSYLVYRPSNNVFWENLIPSLYPYIYLRMGKKNINGTIVANYMLDGNTASLGYVQITEEVYHVLDNCMKLSKSITSIINNTNQKRNEILNELYLLWKKRFIIFKTAAHTGN